MDAERDRIVDELRRYAMTPRSRRIDARVRVLNETLEKDPPKSHAYPMLSLMMVVEYVLGIGLIVLAVFLFSLAISTPTSIQLPATVPLPSDGGRRPDVRLPDPLTAATRQLDMYGAMASLLFGVSMLIGAQLTQLLLDIQSNADRHSFALHGLFYLLLADRKELINEHTQ